MTDRTVVLLLMLVLSLSTQVNPIQAESPELVNPDELDHMLSLDLEDLSNVVISVASKRDERVQDAPSVVSVVTREEIERYGAINLRDLMNRIPSLQTFVSTIPNNTFSIRGQTNQHYTHRVLFLINGRPFRESLAGGHNVPIQQNFPLSVLERIEVIRGPGSVLYGSNAFSGAINLITRKDIKDGNLELSSTFGSFDRLDFEGGAAYSSDDFKVLAAAKENYTSGWKGAITDVQGTTGDFRLSENGGGRFVSLYYKNLSLNLFHGIEDGDYFGTAVTFPLGPNETERSFADLGYKLNFSDSWSLDSNVTLNHIKVSSTNKGINGRKGEAFDVLFEAVTRVQLLDSLEFLLGGTFENDDGKAIVDYNTQRYGAYTQLDYKPLSWLNLLGGFQLNKVKNVEKDLSPRFAAILPLGKNWTAKVMYGEAFRAAYAIESFINFAGVLVGNPKLEPEKIATTEAQLMYHSSSLTAAATVYHSKITDIIGRVRQGAVITYQNEGEESFNGFELEGKFKFAKGWQAEGSFLWQSSEIDDGVDDPNLFPDEMLKLGLSYRSEMGWAFGFFDTYFGAPKALRNVNPSVLEINTHPDHYHMLTGTLTLDIPKLLNKVGEIPQIDLSLYAENLLDEDIYYPEITRRNINSLPSEGGRAFYGKVTLRF